MAEGFESVVGAGDLRKSLEALRDLLAERLVEAKPGESAGLAKQLADVLDRIAGLPGEEKSSLDDLAGRRDARRAQVQKRASSELKRGKRGG